jgi:4,5-DOPA dioxygenase extradiol
MKRASFLKTLALMPLAIKTMNLNDLKAATSEYNNSHKWPAIFIGHGNPMNAIWDNPFTRSLENLGKSFTEKPNAIMVVSAHWLTRGTSVTVSEKPRIIYDFGGFPNELYRVQYPAKGSPEMARETKQSIHSINVNEDSSWGLDHGAWTVLKHMFPNADIPVFQLSIDATQPPAYHFKLANELKALREKGLLIIGSGNIVHNLYEVDFSPNAKPNDWAIEFDDIVRQKLESRNFDELVNYEKFGRAAQLSVPTNDHYLPMLYTIGISDKKDNLIFTYNEIQNSSLSMRCFMFS